MKTANISGTWAPTLQVVSDEDAFPNGSFINEKEGAPEPLQELVPKFTSMEFCALDAN